MKKNLTFILLLAVILFGNLSAQVQHFTWQGVEREYIIRTPAEHDGPLPVLFFLHGLSVLISPCDQEFNFSQMAEDFGWAIVVPQARNLGMGTMWNVGMTNSDVDDAGFLLALLDSLTAQYQLDPDSVFFTGFSMGGFMTHRMAIEHGDRITACAPVSGLIYNEQASLTPVAPVRMLHIHGTNDNVVGYNGYSSVFGMTLGLGVNAIMDYWQNTNGCTGEPTIDTLPDLKNDGLRFIRYTYNCGTDLQHLKVVGGTHTWYDDQYDVDYKNVIYEFFTGRSAPSGIPDRKTGQLRVWPNPTNGNLNIQLPDSDSPANNIKVYDVYGKLVGVVETRHGASLQTVQIDLSRHQDGVYFVQAGNGAVAKVMMTK
jgi:polyhydroxybutyrate depolymerase